MRNAKLRKLLTKGLNFSKAYFQIDQALGSYIEKISTKKQIRDTNTYTLARIYIKQQTLQSGTRPGSGTSEKADPMPRSTIMVKNSFFINSKGLI